MNNTYKIRRENLKTQKTKSVWDADALVFLAEYQIKVEKKKVSCKFFAFRGDEISGPKFFKYLYNHSMNSK